MTTRIRPATIADAPRLSRLGAATFRETFEGENTPEDMARYVAEAFTPERQAAEIADPAGTVLVAERGGTSGDDELVGYAHLASGPAPAAVRGPAPLELKRLYVARAWHGQGVAQALMNAVVDAARARGAGTLWLGVWERNPRAVAFYAKYGFTRVGEHTFMLGADPQTDWVLVRPLGSNDRDVAEFYARGLERDRLAAGLGALEYARTQAVLARVLPAPPAVVADVGGGPGHYAVWLAEQGYRVHLVDVVALHVEQARAAAGARPGATLASAVVGDARALALPDASVDAVLLLGPLYHLPARADRLRALAEARRVCRVGGAIVVAAISRFASTLDGLRGGYLEDPVFAALAAGGRQDGQHRNPTGDPTYFTTAYFHRPEELAAECTAAGLVHEATLAVEGPGWLLSDLDARLADERRRAALLTTLGVLEAEPTLLGVSAHLLAVARRV